MISSNPKEISGSLNHVRRVGFAANVVEPTENGKIGAGAYRGDADGKRSLAARRGMTTLLGTLTRISPGITTLSSTSGGTCISRPSQVVLTAQIDDGPDVLLLLTPKSPAGSAAP